jgi:3',5'-cyclic AMP phosphodiesterase CpdA
MRLAHCSDLHLLSHDGARWLELANKRWIGRMNLISNRSRHYHVAAFEAMVADLNEQGVDHVLCTGDVTNLALRQEFEFARSKFDGLALGPTGVTVIPGNHDAYVAEGVGHFAELFGPFATTDPGWEWTAEDRDSSDLDADLVDGVPHWPIVRLRGGLALIGTSTSRQTPWFTAYGRVGTGQLARLGRVLSDDRLRGKARLVAIHHPPAGKRAQSRIRGLRDHAAFAEVIGAHGADLIVHGHEHRDMTEVLAGPAGPVPVRGIVSGTFFHPGLIKPEKTARYRIFEIADGAITDHVRIWDRERERFAADIGTEQPGQESTNHAT